MNSKYAEPEITVLNVAKMICGGLATGILGVGAMFFLFGV
jgi:hypothetical protein